MNLNEVYSEVIREHNLSHHNKHPLEQPTVEVPGRNPSCGDDIQLFVKMKDGVIDDASYTGSGCAISQASVSIMIDLVRGKTIKEAKELCDLFLKMIRTGDLSTEEQKKMDDAMALSNVSTMPARVKCATMPWHTLQAALDAVEKPS
ncbi:MAG: SUF system NifU family Fe-S cluster assembly protein [Sphaerochaeta sp.]|jgi:nitrogen fixation NifU-like protein|nr:SUF system NifU family Fe-S cluster assembly protein [Sphaerochaeta sp.]MCH3920838.1 SUF system NifU family Fe-S cluster assembly protein [Sphaerochaeta sp.]MCI2045563.1 SUF system NifU family Fe-S cluster assembly protein [Sphaerochaeta sp.]MCI2076802.1 SUF system NifU family Fe-S cluster assembly protein [Sphaerochaeta sp.]MCI2097521.1 SUF system NifU family Fe-S cluster assembly protein [Sphaerochaeta sp.]